MALRFYCFICYAILLPPVFLQHTTQAQPRDEIKTVSMPSSTTQQTTPATLSESSDLQAVEEALHTVFAWAVNKDFDRFYQTIAADSNFISVTPYDRVKFGIRDVKKDSSFWGSPQFKAIRHEIRDLRVHFSNSGDVAWFFCMLDDINEWKGQPANWENVRWTGVLEKRQGRWVVVLQHFSFAAKQDS